MKLQVNTSGSWKNVCEFPGDRLAEVRDAATKLGEIMGRDARFCIVGDDGRREWLDKSGLGAHAATERVYA